MVHFENTRELQFMMASPWGIHLSFILLGQNIYLVWKLNQIRFSFKFGSMNNAVDLFISISSILN